MVNQLLALLNDIKPYVGSRDKHSKLCGHSSWKAAGDKSGKYDGLTIAGRFFAGCDHLMVHRALNMAAAHGGERYAYFYLMMADYFIPNGVKFAFGDLMCKWAPWLEKVVPCISAHLEGQSDPSLASIPVVDMAKLLETDMATSAVHNQAHVWYCQVCSCHPSYLQYPSTRKGALAVFYQESVADSMPSAHRSYLAHYTRLVWA